MRFALLVCVAVVGLQSPALFEDNFANGIITKRLIELAKAGERNPYQLCEGALSNLREHLFGD